MSFKYDLHVHTKESSACAHNTGKEMAQFYKSLGYDGICITDHFLNGNTTVPKDLSWAKQIEMFSKGYRNAKQEGEKIGLRVFFGWEYSYRGTDLLTYGLDKKWLLNHPDLLDYSINEYCELIREEGGFIAQAHPFREADYIDMIRLLPRGVNAVEIINASMTDFVNQRAAEYADNYELLKQAGSDAHAVDHKQYSGIKTTQAVNSLDKLLELIKQEKIEVFLQQFNSEEVD